jgi:hypothetical protein
MTTKITDLADFEDPDQFGQPEIFKWATSDTGGGLPAVSALPFSSWIDNQWNEYDDGSGTQTNEDVLKAAVAFWTGRA